MRIDGRVHRLVVVSAMLVLSALCDPICTRAQQRDKWQRVYTGEDSVIELNVSSHKLEPNRILRVQFRTVFSKPESLRGTPEAKYKSRLETIDFKLNERRYRLSETTLLDSGGKVLQTYTATAQDDWRVIKDGGVMDKLFFAARSLLPFGNWKVVTYRYAEGIPGGTKPVRELERLIRTPVRFLPDRAEVGDEICTSPAFQNKRSTREEFVRELGVELKSIGISAESAETINVKCEGPGWQPPRSLLIKVNEGELLMLWDGVFLVLERDGQGGVIDLRPTLKRRAQ